ncbi:Putative F-box domain-containing protein [Septoria linicola]|uniref:F-box domain-containing protein n=1 Tax=Septoria linicola TaxID=215465 RepID=A0A9Q9EKU2_9PEZI|nr:putative F-box domain-containing protein [Septoria linicola]USW55156.1 Putative F-box domain-containing protein [Septoria linicola]
MAAATVFSTVELLETILANLPTKDLLLSQRVSTTFRNTIQGSIHLRRALYLSPGQPGDIDETLHSLFHERFSYTASGIPASVVLNPLLVNGVNTSVRYAVINPAALVSDLPRLSCDQMYITLPPWKVFSIRILVGIPRDFSGFPAPASMTELYIDQLERAQTFGQIRAACRAKIEQWLRQEGRMYDVVNLAENSRFLFDLW